ncbi:hypothetical protein PoB_002696200 [Plakobranchus ocellatus]|uniref:Uncharacterized protein n=1 Tax=Plakobranchus ocellatus TaxID=259542 RepID=A0AAV3ZZJ2_9GAST|nr:hypothetical protein PoB_002696200 [Plakobranchus ocellatus]
MLVNSILPRQENRAVLKGPAAKHTRSAPSFIFNEGKNVQTWLPKDLDQLLKHGDWLSINYGRRDECPLISEIPNAVWLDGRQYEIKIGSSEYGSFESADFPFDVHRLEHLLKKYKYFIITIGNRNPAYSCAIIVGDNEFYYVFDPHSRNEKGLADPCGRATLTTHHKDQLENFFKNLAKSLSASVFEITSVALAQILNASILEETSAPSDAIDILTCFESDSSSSDDIPLSRYTFLSEQISAKRKPRASKRKAIETLTDILNADGVEENTYGHISDSSEEEEYLPEEERRKRYAQAVKMCYNRMVKSGSYGSIKTMLSEIVDNVVRIKGSFFFQWPYRKPQRGKRYLSRMFTNLFPRKPARAGDKPFSRSTVFYPVQNYSNV